MASCIPSISREIFHSGTWAEPTMCNLVVTPGYGCALRGNQMHRFICLYTSVYLEACDEKRRNDNRGRSDKELTPTFERAS